MWPISHCWHFEKALKEVQSLKARGNKPTDDRQALTSASMVASVQQGVSQKQAAIRLCCPDPIYHQCCENKTGQPVTSPSLLPDQYAVINASLSA